MCAALAAAGVRRQTIPTRKPRLKAAVVAHKEEFVRGFIEHVLSYALGRELELCDLPAVEEIEAAAAADGWRLSSILSAVATSYPFRNTRTQ